MMLQCILSGPCRFLAACCLMYLTTSCIEVSELICSLIPHYYNIPKLITSAILVPYTGAASRRALGDPNQHPSTCLGRVVGLERVFQKLWLRSFYTAKSVHVSPAVRSLGVVTAGDYFLPEIESRWENLTQNVHIRSSWQLLWSKHRY